MKEAIAGAFTVLVIVSATTLLLAKGGTTKITITNSELPRPIEVNDPELLKHFNVWSGPGTFANGVEGNDGFIIDWARGVATERPSGLRNFELSFFVRYANRPFRDQTDQLAYIVSYAVDPATGQGYVYLPGKGDERFRFNVRSIYCGREGGWFHASAAWQRAFRTVVLP